MGVAKVKAVARRPEPTLFTHLLFAQILSGGPGAGKAPGAGGAGVGELVLGLAAAASLGAAEPDPLEESESFLAAAL